MTFSGEDAQISGATGVHFFLKRRTNLEVSLRFFLSRRDNFGGSKCYFFLGGKMSCSSRGFSRKLRECRGLQVLFFPKRQTNLGFPLLLFMIR